MSIGGAVGTFGAPERPTLPVRIRGKLWPFAAWILLVRAMLRRTPTELWIGDSHAMTFNQRIDNAMFFRGPQGQLILRVGARLMWSLGTKGFPPRVQRVARLGRVLARRGSIIPVFCAGEIDVRAHLPRRPATEDYSFVRGYVEHGVEIGRALKAETIGFAVPPPPVGMTNEESWYPIAGSIELRVEVHRRVRSALAAAIDQTPGAVLLDFTDLLADESGAMPLDRTVDGCHTNEESVRAIRQYLTSSGLLQRRGADGVSSAAR